MSASAAIVTTGSINPSGVVFSDTNNAPPSWVSLGQQGAGTLTADDGSFFAPSMLYVGAFGQGDAHIQGPGSGLSLTGINYTQANRLIAGQSGVGALTISNGAVLDGTQRASDGCDNGARGAILAHGAGSQGRLTVTGSGSQTSFLGGISLAQVEVYTLENGGFVYGTPGVQARADMQIPDGARVTSGSGVLASAPTSPAALGNETSLATVLIDGPGSVWTIQRTAANTPQPFLALASHAHGTARMMIRNGGKLVIDGGTFGGTGSSAYTAFNLSRGGSGHVTVTGAGSAIEMAGRGTIILVRRERGSATLEVLDGALVTTQNLQIAMARWA